MNIILSYQTVSITDPKRNPAAVIREASLEKLDHRVKHAGNANLAMRGNPQLLLTC